MKSPLKNSVTRKVDQVTLNDQQLHRLQSMQNAMLDEPAKSHRLKWLTSVAAMLLLALTISVINPFAANQPLERQIADEVITNHLKLKPLDVETASITAARQYFTQLDFSVIASENSIIASNTLLGGRYCSIKGITAAQLRYQAGPSLVTIYQVPYSSEKFAALKEGASLQQDGLNVDIWVEKGVLLVSVSE